MEKIKWQAMTQGKTVVIFDIRFKNQTTPFKISIVSNRCLKYIFSKKAERRAVLFVQPFSNIDGLTTWGFQPETGYHITTIKAWREI